MAKRKYNTVSRTKRRMDSNTPVGQKNVLTLDESMLDRTRFHYEIVNEDPGNVESYKARDFDIVTDMSGMKVGDEVAGGDQPDGSVIRKDVGGGQTAILMSKPIEWHKDDENREEERLQEVESNMEQENKQKHEGNFG